MLIRINVLQVSDTTEDDSNMKLVK